MSILDGNIPIIPEPVAKKQARYLVQQARAAYQQIVNTFNQGSKNFWANSAGASPEEIAAELGIHAKEVFELHYKLGQFIASIRPEDVVEGNNLVGNFTMNEDGTVTILSSPAPE